MAATAGTSKIVLTGTSDPNFSHLDNVQGESGILCTCGSKYGCVLHPLGDDIPDAPDIKKDEIPESITTKAEEDSEEQIEGEEEETEVNPVSPALTPLDLSERSILITFSKGTGIPKYEFKGEWRGLFLKRVKNGIDKAYKIYQKGRLRDAGRKRA